MIFPWKLDGAIVKVCSSYSSYSDPGVSVGRGHMYAYTDVYKCMLQYRYHAFHTTNVYKCTYIIYINLYAVLSNIP